jgi:uncharacterized protein (DUF362 family)
MAQDHPIVAILKSGGDYPALWPRLLELAEAADVVRPGESVLVKPNLHANADPATASVTDPALVGAILDWLRERGAGEILVADGPFFGNTEPEQNFLETGMAAVVEARGAQWRAVNGGPWREFRDFSPYWPPLVRIFEPAFTYDRIINVAVAKTHMDCLVTLGMKNLKGLVHPEEKALFHQLGDLDRALQVLNQVVRPDLTVVDGTLGMEGLGPHAGTVAEWGYLFAGRETVAVDAVAAPAMGAEIQGVRAIRYAIEAGVVDPARIEVRGEDPALIYRRFERPYEAMLRQLPGVRLAGEAACSACKLNLIRALCEEAGAGVNPPERCIAAGKALVEDPEALLIGKCAGAANPGRPHLPGCPPRVEKVKEYLRGG